MIQTRKASLKDGPVIIGLLSAFYNFSDPEEAWEVFHREMSLHYHFRVAEEEGEILGVMSWRMHGLPKHGIMKLKRIAVAREYPDREAVLEMLFDSTVADADYYYRQQESQLRKVYIVTPQQNSFVQSFMEEKGMTLEAVLRSHYYQGRDECMYSLFTA